MGSTKRLRVQKTKYCSLYKSMPCLCYMSNYFRYNQEYASHNLKIWGQIKTSWHLHFYIFTLVQYFPFFWKRDLTAEKEIKDVCGCVLLILFQWCPNTTEVTSLGTYVKGKRLLDHFIICLQFRVVVFFLLILTSSFF